MIFGKKEIDNFDPYNVLFAITTNILYCATYDCFFFFFFFFGPGSHIFVNNIYFIENIWVI